MKAHSDHLIDRLSHGGVLLTTQKGDKINTMTIGWGSIGIYWGKKILIVPVRKSRFTYEMMEASDNFTVSVPKYNEIAKQIAYCGVNSGRDMDKLAECGLSTEPAKSVDTPIIKEAYLHYECKIVAKQDIDNNHFNAEIYDKWYDDAHGKDNFHTLYYGEIVECYIDGE